MGLIFTVRKYVFFELYYFENKHEFTDFYTRVLLWDNICVYEQSIYVPVIRNTRLSWAEW